TTYLGSTIVKYAPIIDAETVDIAEAVKVYIRCLGIKGSCFLIEINTSDCPKIAEATALYDSSLPMPLILEITKDRKSTRLKSSHVSISYAVFCLKKKKYK